MAWFVCLEQLPARPLIDFFIRFRSDVWPGQRDGRRLFRHAVPGCFPDLKGVLWLGFCAWNRGSAGHTLDFFIRFRSDVWPGQRDGRRLFRHAVLWLVLCAWNNCLPDPLARAEGRQEAVSSRRARVSCRLFCVPGTIACQTLDFFIRFRSDVWPGQRDGRRLFRHTVPGCFPDLKGVLWLVLCAWNNCLPDP